MKLRDDPYFSPLNQGEKGWVSCSVDKHFETGRDLRNFYDKQIFENVDAMFIGISRRDLSRVEFFSAPSRDFETFRARSKKLKGATLTDET